MMDADIVVAVDEKGRKTFIVSARIKHVLSEEFMQAFGAGNIAARDEIVDRMAYASKQLLDAMDEAMPEIAADMHDKPEDTGNDDGNERLN